MTRSSKAPRSFAFVLILSIGVLQRCYSAPKDPFTLTSKAVEPNRGPSDLSNIDEGYAWGFATLGFMLNGHGLPDHYRTDVITHRSVDGKTELIWPVFEYGKDQANAEVLDHTLVFTAMLPDGTPVLMAHRMGGPPMVISAAVLRLAARRLGTSVIVPGTDYYFTKVRQPPGRIWLKGQPRSSQGFPPQGVFTVELTPDDLRKVMDETRQSGTLYPAKKFEYLSEPGAPIHITAEVVKESEATTPVPVPQSYSSVAQRTPYIPKNERLYGHVQLDPVNHYAYFSTIREPGRILKVALGDDSRMPATIVGTLTFEGGEDRPFNSVIDPKDGYAYFGTAFPGHLVKVALGQGNAPPSRVGAVMVDENETAGTGVVDGGYGIFQVGRRLVKIRLGKGNELPGIVSRVEIPEKMVTSFASAVLDPKTHYAYFGSDWIKVYKVALGQGDAPPKFVSSLALHEDEFDLRGALIDPENGFAWFASQNGILVKVALGQNDEAPRRIGALKIGSKYQYLENTFGLDHAGYAYLGTMGGGKTGDPACCVAAVLKIALGKGDDLPRLVSALPLPDGVDITEGVVSPTDRTLCLGVNAEGVGCKLLKLSLGEGDAAPKILATTRLYLK